MKNSEFRPEDDPDQTNQPEVIKTQKPKGNDKIPKQNCTVRRIKE